MRCSTLYCAGKIHTSLQDDYTVTTVQFLHMEMDIKQPTLKKYM